MTGAASAQRMTGDANLYRRYTSTAALPDGTDTRALLEWSCGYFAAHVAPLLPADRGAAIAEIGCGWGRYLVALAEAGYVRSEGVDVSEEQVAYAREHLGLTNVSREDATAWLAARRDRFDCVLALDILEHLDTDALVTLMDAVRAALRPGGVVIVHAPNALAPLSPLRYADLTHVRAFTVGSLAQLFRAAGLTPRAFHETEPRGRGPLATIRRTVWKAALRPLVKAWMLAANGDAMGGIYTANVIAVAERSRNAS
jgi:2-polyprenyl-3-methyl-5-hydroxy-6-metoxy-1,4-benzoquinol methylase